MWQADTGFDAKIQALSYNDLSLPNIVADFLKSLYFANLFIAHE